MATITCFRRNLHICRSLAARLSTVPQGELGTSSYRLAFRENSHVLSPWHDIPMKKTDRTFNAIIEIPKMTKAKMEVSTKEEGNPIAQDVKKGKLRNYHGPIFWNYGMIPQTWENPEEIHPELKVAGDNDPVDVVEVGSKAIETGTVVEVKALGALAMIDDGELDWKVIAISVDDPKAPELNNVEDLERVMPGTISGIREWFRWYKTPDGKPLNSFGYEEECLDASVAVKILDETHETWRALKEGKIDKGKLWVQ